MIIALLVALLPVALENEESAWSKEVLVRHGSAPVVRYQARIEGQDLIVKATHEAGWHTYAMDNELRAAEALQGKKSLGIEQGIEIKVESGVQLDDRWLQTEPQDLSKPELRWYTYGFDQTAFFVCRVKRVTTGKVGLRIRGQACSGETCCQVDVVLHFPLTNDSVEKSTASASDPANAFRKGLVPVKTEKEEADPEEPNS